MSAPQVYLVTGLVTVSVSTEVVASSEAEAFEIAEGRGLQSLCRQCSARDNSVEWCLTGELDGEVRVWDTEGDPRSPTGRELRHFYAARGR